MLECRWEGYSSLHVSVCLLDIFKIIIDFAFFLFHKYINGQITCVPVYVASCVKGLCFEETAVQRPLIAFYNRCHVNILCIAHVYVPLSVFSVLFILLRQFHHTRCQQVTGGSLRIS